MVRDAGWLLDDSCGLCKLFSFLLHQYTGNAFQPEQTGVQQRTHA